MRFSGEVGDNACSGVEACQESKGIVLDMSCRGHMACFQLEGNVGTDSWYVKNFVIAQKLHRFFCLIGIPFT